MNKMCQNHELLLVTELSFCNDPKANGKHFWIFVEATRDVNFLQKYFITAALYLHDPLSSHAFELIQVQWLMGIPPSYNAQYHRQYYEVHR